MKKLESTFRNMVISLFLVTLISAVCLSAVVILTNEPIALATLEKKLKAIRSVVPAFTNNPNEERFAVFSEENLSIEIYPAKNNQQIIGTAVKTYSKQGYSGLIWLMVGFDTDEKIYNISVLNHKETPGLGDKMKKPAFIKQFIGKHPGKNNLRCKKDGGEIDAITAATITSRAFCEAVNRAYKTQKQTKNQPTQTDE